MGQGKHSLTDPAKLFRQIAPVAPFAGSDQLGWSGLHAIRFRDVPASEIISPGMAHHLLVLITRPPEKLELRYEGVKRDKPPPPGYISIVPSACVAQWRWTGPKDSLHIFLDPELIARVASESFELDSARTEIPPFDGLKVPEIRAAMLAVNAELATGGIGGPILVESLANVLAVHLIRHFMTPRKRVSRADNVLPPYKLNTVIEYVMENLDNDPTLEQMAAVARLSPYHFARQFRKTTGLPPHQYVIARRVERAQHILKRDHDVSLGEVALRVGFSDQSQFSFHFKRIAGVTPGQYRISARIA
jgi:AraC family transcriptional regulator